MPYVVAYDIADPRRLRRVGRFMAGRALRCQKSVFWFAGDGPSLLALLDDVLPLLDLTVDVVQAWRLASGESSCGEVRGALVPVDPCAVGLVAGEEPWFVARPGKR